MDGEPFALQAIDGEPDGFLSASPWKFLGRGEVTVSTEDTAAARVTDLDMPGAYDNHKYIYCRVRDKAGRRPGYFYGADSFWANATKENGGTGAVTHAGRYVYRVNDDGTLTAVSVGGTTGYGVYGYNITSADKVGVNRRYHATYTPIIDGTFTVEVYALDPPTGKTVFGT